MVIEAIALARKLMCQYHTNDPRELASILNIEVRERYDFTTQRGMFIVILNNRYIFVNGNLSEQMKRMVIAHELGHALLHWEEGKRPSGLLEFELFDIKDQKEYDANAFAATLLIDENELKYYAYTEQFDIVSIARIMNVNVNLLLLKMAEMNREGANFNIPMIQKRNFLGTIDDNAGEL